MNRIKNFFLVNIIIFAITAFVLTLVPLFTVGEVKLSIYAILSDKFRLVTILCLILYAICVIYSTVLIVRKNVDRLFYYASFVFLAMTICFFLSTIVLVLGTV